MKSKLKLKKGFTIIELIIVMVVIGVLVLLAAPKLVGYSEKAKAVKISSDIKTVENLLIEDQSLGLGQDFMIGGLVDKVTLDSIGSETGYVAKNVYGKKGKIKNFDKTKEYYHLNEKIASDNTKTSPGGIYIISKDDESIYYIEIKETSDWIINDKNEFIYTGSDSIVKIPEKINGVKVNTYKKMFAENKTVEKVIRNNQAIKDMSYMFDNGGIRNKTLDVSSLNTDSVETISKMFRKSRFNKIFGLSNFNTSNVNDMEQLFDSAYFEVIDVRSFEAFNTSNLRRMFRDSRAKTIMFSDKFDTVRTYNFESMFENSQVESLVGLKYLDLSGSDVNTILNSLKESDGSRKEVFTGSLYTFKNMGFWENELDSGRILSITGKHEIVKRGQNDNGDGSPIIVPKEKPEYSSSQFEKVNDGIIGQIGILKKENVSGIEKSILNPEVSIKIPKGSNSSGQIRTIKPQGRGAYSADIKTTNNEGQLHGFFLFNVVDKNSYEIDIEIFMEDDKWKIMTTIFNPTHPNYSALNSSIQNAEQGVIFHEKQELNFDPSADFHNYKINLAESFVSFSIDDNEVSRFNGTFDFQPMRLYAGSFYAHWLQANKSIYNNNFDSDDKRRLREYGIDAYKKVGLEDKLKEYFGRNEDYYMKVKNIKLEEN